MNQDFQKSLVKNQNIIFNDMSPSERAEYERKKIINRKKIEMLEQQIKEREQVEKENKKKQFNSNDEHDGHKTLRQLQ